ncbi:MULTISPECIES: hypothetical protein [Pseudomonas]|uniref:DUF5983 domain-containing protein n=1 Tax=Pseudomonas putida ND6 TaxID=231023 RepID=I3UNX0_PSEPU|nr:MULTISPECIES: hypothetical protein [Pseudomonas]AFK67191.1 hypothetical protein YSA_00763 [Pseudomonas putida ND6]MDD2076628.1 hypothetical protein [Pseudomonas putida]HDS1692499.1 hypothetical protein [Pseudomonas putida]
MHPSLPNPFLRGFQDLRYERVLQISYADDCPPCYRALHPAQNELPNEAINLQPCLFDDDFAVITDGVCVPEFLRMRCPADGLVNTVLYQILGSQLRRSMHIGDLGNAEAAQNLIEQLSFATGHYSRSWEISSAHLPADDLEYLQVRAWCNSPASFFECFELNVSHAVGCKLYSTPWVADIKAGGSSCSADEVSARMLADRVPPVLLKLLLLAGQADIRLLIFDPDAAPLSELPLFTEE